MSARVRPSATASLPEMSISVSSWTAAPPAGLVATAMDILLVCWRPPASGARRFGYARHDRRGVVHVAPGLHALLLRVLTGDPFGHRSPTHLEGTLGELFLVLAAVTEAVGAHGGDLVLDLLARPDAVRVLVLAPHVPLALVVVERGLVHPRVAVLPPTDRLAHPAPAARVHVGVVEAVRRHVEDAVRALDPAERALHAGIEVDDRPHRAGRELLEVRVPLRPVTLPALHGLADGDRGDR